MVINFNQDKSFILTALAVRKLYANKKGVKAINFNLKENQIVAIVGKSGSGKSTLLRLLSGLAMPDAGVIKYKGEKVISPIEGVNMVFQNYALLPWESVFNNVAFGLQAKGLPKSEIKEKVDFVLNLIGLSGFEGNYPSELSGGMCQRVGFARALVMQPEILMLDEAFSALDAVTAQQLRSDFMDLWLNDKLNIKSIVMVTHSIKEALLMADRILLVGGSPGVILEDISLDSNMDRKDASLIARYENDIYEMLLAS